MKFVLRIACASLLLVAIAGQVFASGGQEGSQPQELVKMQYWHEWAPDGAAGLVLQKLVDEFNAKYSGQIEMTLAYMGGKRNEKIAAALAAGEPPEVAWISGSGEKYYDAGQLMDMDMIYDDIVAKADVLPGLRENMQYVGKDITLPHENSSLALYYNKKMLDEKGIAYPSATIGDYTRDDFIRDANAFTDVKAGKYGWEPRWSTAMLFSVFWERGGELFSDDYKTNLIGSSPKDRQAMVEALEWLNRILWVDPITANDVGDQGFGNGDIPFEIVGPWAMPRYLKPAGQFDPGDLGVAPMPADPETGKVVTYWYQKALALFKVDSAHEWATLRFIEWFYSAPVHARWCAEAGYLPITKSASEDPTWVAHEKNNEWVQTFMELTPLMRRRPSGIPAGDLNKLRDIVRFQEGTPDDAINTYLKDAQALLDEFWSMQ